MTTRTGNAVWEGTLKEGTGNVKLGSTTMANAPWSPETAMRLWNSVAVLIEQRKLTAPTAAMLRARACDDKLLEALWRGLVSTKPLSDRLGMDAEEHLIYSCEYLAQQRAYSHYCLTHQCAHEPHGPQRRP